MALVGYLVKNQKEIRGKVGGYRTLIADTRGRFEEAQGGYRAGRYDAASRNLMVDGLLKRFLDEVDAVVTASSGDRELGGAGLARPSDQHQRLEAADREADEQARTQHVLDLAAAVFGVDDDLARLVALLRIEHAHLRRGRHLFAQGAQLGGLALRLGIRRRAAAPRSRCRTRSPPSPAGAGPTRWVWRDPQTWHSTCFGSWPTIATMLWVVLAPQRPHHDSTSAPTPGPAAGGPPSRATTTRP